MLVEPWFSALHGNRAGICGYDTAWHGRIVYIDNGRQIADYSISNRNVVYHFERHVLQATRLAQR